MPGFGPEMAEAMEELRRKMANEDRTDEDRRLELKTKRAQQAVLANEIRQLAKELGEEE